MAEEEEMTSDPEKMDPNNEPTPENPIVLRRGMAALRKKRMQARFVWENDDLELIAEGDGELPEFVEE